VAQEHQVHDGRRSDHQQAKEDLWRGRAVQDPVPQAVQQQQQQDEPAGPPERIDTHGAAQQRLRPTAVRWQRCVVRCHGAPRHRPPVRPTLRRGERAYVTDANATLRPYRERA